MRQRRVRWLHNALRGARAWWSGQVTAQWRGRWRRRDGAASGFSEAQAVAALGGADARSRWEAAAALGRNAQRSREAMLALGQALADPEPFVRWHAAEALGRQDAGGAFLELRELLHGSPDVRQRAGAAEGLGRMGGEAAGVALREALADPAPAVRAAAARALGAGGDPTAAQAILPLLADRSVEVRCAAAYALGRTGDPGMACSLAEALGQPGNPLLLRRALAAALAHIPHPETQPTLLAALSDEDAQVRGYAAQALGQVGNEMACEPLAALRNDGARLLHGTVGEAASRALALLERRGR